MLKRLFLILPYFIILLACTNKGGKPEFSDTIIIGKTIVHNHKAKQKPEPHTQISIKGISRLSERLSGADIHSKSISLEERTDTILIPKGTIYQFNFGNVKAYVNSGSRIIINQSGNTINLDFCGEAYFTTPHDQITINAGNGLQVLADSNSRFTITNYADFADEPLLKLGLLNGRLLIVGDDRSMSVFPGQQLQFDRRFPVIASAKFDSAKSLAWTRQEYYFDDADAFGIFEKLSRWYNVSIGFPRSAVANYHFHIVANFSDPIEKILDIINGTLDHEAFILKDNKITLEKS